MHYWTSLKNHQCDSSCGRCVYENLSQSILQMLSYFKGEVRTLSEVIEFHLLLKISCQCIQKFVRVFN